LPFFHLEIAADSRRGDESREVTKITPCPGDKEAEVRLLQRSIELQGSRILSIGPHNGFDVNGPWRGRGTAAEFRQHRNQRAYSKMK
jgi:hypothetical protein